VSKFVFESDTLLVKPSQIIFYMLDEAIRRTDLDALGEFGVQAGRTWHHRALADRIDEYIEREVARKLEEFRAEMLE
jgi:hypothetical protein